MDFQKFGIGSTKRNRLKPSMHEVLNRIQTRMEPVPFNSSKRIFGSNKPDSIPAPWSSSSWAYISLDEQQWWK